MREEKVLAFAGYRSEIDWDFSIKGERRRKGRRRVAVRAQRGLRT